MASAAANGGSAAGAPLCREAFRRTATVTTFRVPASRCSDAVKHFRSALFRVPRLRPIVPVDGGMRLVRLAEGQSADSLTDAQRAFLRDVGAELAPESVELGYENMSTDEVLRQVLPSGAEVPSSFETVGHVAHLNLRDELLPHRRAIAQVLLDKNPRLRTVVNKVGAIETEFRTFPMEVLAGDDDLSVEVSESGCRFRFNFRDVYWNSRLHTEHGRVLDCMQRGDVVCDMFCGVGPFAVPAAKRGFDVFANDLNPSSHRHLVENAKINKVQLAHGFRRPDHWRAIHPRCSLSPLPVRGQAPMLQPGRARVRAQAGRGGHAVHAGHHELARSSDRVPRSVGAAPPSRPHSPALTPAAPPDVFRGGWAQARPPPVVHCYGFANPETAERDIREVQRLQPLRRPPLRCA